MKRLTLGLIASSLMLSACNVSITQTANITPRYDWNDVSRIHGNGEMGVEIFDRFGQPITNDKRDAILDGLNKAVLSAPISFVAREDLAKPQTAGLRIRLSNTDYPNFASRMCTSFDDQGKVRNLENTYATTAIALGPGETRMQITYCYSGKSWADISALYVQQPDETLNDLLGREVYHAVSLLLPEQNPHTRDEACRLDPNC